MWKRVWRPASARFGLVTGGENRSKRRLGERCETCANCRSCSRRAQRNFRMTQEVRADSRRPRLILRSVSKMQRTAMRITGLVLASLVLLYGGTLLAESPAPQPQGRPLSPDSSVDEILDALDARGRNLREFVADVSLTENDQATAFDSIRTGRVYYQKQKDDDRIRVIFDEKLEGRFAKSEKVEYLLQKGWLTDRDYQRSVEVKRQVLKPGEKVNLLKLGEGPFPLPIGQAK